MSELRTENDALIQALNGAQAPDELEPGAIYGYKLNDRVHVVDLLDRDRESPQRKTGTVVVEDVASFLHYYGKHADEASEVYVDVDGKRITAVINAHTSIDPRWGDHRLVLQLRTTKAWQEWVGQDRKPMSQQTFAEFVEDHLGDIREPSAADMLEIATTFQAKTKVNFSSAMPLASGDRRLVFEETTDASAGAKGQLQVPTVFKIAVKCLELPVAEGEDPTVYGIDARFRYRIQGGSLQVVYLLDDTAAVLRDAVLAVVGQVETALGIVIMRGTPSP
ncbi:DUF2303 family protein [Streptosporangium sp. NPDC051022]|uniref:DUF2303 family protein n=1 Tax=Streptosporangium sp. NPDC051022 TaxID=3155752 RepID=UPI003446A984